MNFILGLSLGSTCAALSGGRQRSVKEGSPFTIAACTRLKLKPFLATRSKISLPPEIAARDPLLPLRSVYDLSLYQIFMRAVSAQ